MSDDLQRLLAIDPLAEAEKITGHSYKDDESTMRLGFGLGQIHGDAKREALIARDDTHFMSDWFDTMRIFSDLGFSIVHQHTFDGGYEGHREERFVVLWRPDGVLAKAESYGAGRNTADIYYNWRPNEGVDHWGLTSSGGYHRESYDAGDTVWIGHHDVREAVRHTLAALEENGSFVTPWIQRPFLWLLDYCRSKVPNCDYAAINESVIALLPEHVHTAITPEG